MSWKKSIKDAESKSSWRDSIQTEPSDISMLESGVRGLAQGASLGFADEITGAVESAFTDKTYEQARDESRQAYHEAEDANPVTFGVGDIGGSIGSTVLLPGAGALSTAGRVGAAALGGAASGLGLSEADDIKTLAKDTAIGAGLGAGLSSLGEKVLGPAFKKAGNFIKDNADDAANWTVKKLGKVGASVPEEVTERYLNRASKINSAADLNEVAERFIGEGGTLESLKNHISQLDEQAWNTLTQKQVYAKEGLLNEGSKLVQTILKGSGNNLSRQSGVGASAEVIDGINKQLQQISKAYGDRLSEMDLKSIIQDLHSYAYGLDGNPKTSFAAKGVRQFAGLLNEALKNNNKEYQAAMEPVAEATNLLAKAEKLFINQQQKDSSNKSVNAFKNMLNPNKMTDERDVLRQIKDRVNIDTEEQVLDSLSKGAFDKSDTNGSRKTLLGSLAGQTVERAAGAGVGYAAGSTLGGDSGGQFGALAGATAGFGLDKYAGAIFKRLLNGKIGADEAIKILGPKLGKYSSVLQNAASRGNKAVATTHFILSQKDPEYRKLVQELEKAENEN